MRISGLLQQRSEGPILSSPSVTSQPTCHAYVSTKKAWNDQPGGGEWMQNKNNPAEAVTLGLMTWRKKISADILLSVGECFFTKYVYFVLLHYYCRCFFIEMFFLLYISKTGGWGKLLNYLMPSSN